MNRHVFLFIQLYFILLIAASCNNNLTPAVDQETEKAKLYYHNDTKQNYPGELSDSSFTALKQYLTNATNTILKDTIIIKYDYNNETCWNSLDQHGKKYIMRLVNANKKRIEQILAKRENISLFTFREPGNNINKLKKWDPSILIDSTKQLFNLLFSERCTCGSSILIMPDKKFVFLRSDAHSEIFNLPPWEIVAILRKQQN
ncbi:MAG: hypothetical protein ACN4EP_05570 [Sediminibacterium sp.]